MSLNKVVLIGRLGKDPVAIETKKGDAMCAFSLATNERWKDASGTPKERTTWHDVVAFGGLADVCLKHLKKGQQIYLEGKLRHDKNAKGFPSTSVVMEQLVMLGSAPKGAPEAVEEGVPF